MVVTQAYEVLSDEGRRAFYDRVGVRGGWRGLMLGVWRRGELEGAVGRWDELEWVVLIKVIKLEKLGGVEQLGEVRVLR